MMYGGWYAVAMSANHRAIAIIAGPVQDRTKAEALLEPARAASVGRFNGMDGAIFLPALLAFPDRVPGCENAALWVNPEYAEYPT